MSSEKNPDFLQSFVSILKIQIKVAGGRYQGCQDDGSYIELKLSHSSSNPLRFHILRGESYAKLMLVTEMGRTHGTSKFETISPDPN
jgi:hypothetical protein